MKTPTKQQIEYVRLALSLTGLPVNTITAEHILVCMDELRRLGGKFSVRDASKIEAYINAKYKLAKKVKTVTAKQK